MVPFGPDEIRQTLQNHMPSTVGSTYNKTLGKIADLFKEIKVPSNEQLAAGVGGPSAAGPGAYSQPTPFSVGTSTFEGCVTLNQDPGYIMEDGESRRIEGWIALGGNRRQLLIRTNGESGGPAMCDLVAPEHFRTEHPRCV
ncbi:hypothetical protein LTR49_024826 [Elasticomyces elasticus]|nr:hypothetical protein LTR49_024826 [Elasticomyces elasticus]